MRRLLAKYLAQRDRYADRHQPRPKVMIASGLTVLVIFVGVVIFQTMTGRDASGLDAAVRFLPACLIMLNGPLMIHTCRYSFRRAVVVYGPDWRELTRTERNERWARYRQREQARAAVPTFFADQLAYQRPLTTAAGDPSDPYKTPRNRS